MGEAGVELARDNRSAGDMPAGKDPTCTCRCDSSVIQINHSSMGQVHV